MPSEDPNAPKKGLLSRLLGLGGLPAPPGGGTPGSGQGQAASSAPARPNPSQVRSGTDVFRQSAQSAAAPRPRPQAPATSQLVQPQAPRAQVGTGNVFPGDGLPPDEASEERLAFLDAFFDDPTASRLFQDARYMYKVVSDERNHQVSLVLRRASELRELESGMSPEDLADEPVAIPALPPGPDGEPAPELMDALAVQQARTEKVEARLALMADRDQSQARADLLFRLMKDLTGKKGRTGGTGFLAPPPEDTP